MGSGNKSAALIANGLIENYQAIRSLLLPYSTLIAVDGGLHHCRAMGIRPTLLLGDLDSVSREDCDFFTDLPIKRYPVEKDETDVELALRYLIDECQSSSVTLFGVLGKRTDHSVYNLTLLTRYPDQTTIESETEVLFAIRGTKIISTLPGQTLSLFQLAAVLLEFQARG